ncbi:30S ribosomal protein S14 [Natronobeatus ordinarius]|uniref:30S ribosomal protein S14 n=1 Tax=Natronobeatus ordinarius TaxID=2963433 RepID=UPI0020CD141A|nr:30S ribosomal protein S14 [Natronobeatus ordinarius]
MSESENETGEVATGQTEACPRCGRKQGLVGKYDINLCRQCFREIARDMGFKKYK